MKSGLHGLLTLIPKAPAACVVLLSCSLLSCASTTIYENGQPVFKSQADLTNVSFKTARTSFRADLVEHSDATLAGAQATTQIIGAVSGLAGTVGTSVVAGIAAGAHPVTAVVATGATTGVAHTTNATNVTNTNRELTRRKMLRANPELRR
jgi:hypothetical protein